MDTHPGTIWGREPAMALALVPTAVVLGLTTRSRVSPA
jgi:hypothetical protein